MFLDDEPPIAGGREIWGFPKKFANPEFGVSRDTLYGKLFYQGLPVAYGTMSYKTKAIPEDAVVAALSKPQTNLKIIPCVRSGEVRIAQLVEYEMTDIVFHEGWEGSARVQLFEHANAPATSLPVRSVLPGKHFRADISLPYGKILHDYLDCADDTEEEGRLGRSKILQTAMPAMSPSYSLGPDRGGEALDPALYRTDEEYLNILYSVDVDTLLDYIPERLVPMVDDSGKAVISLRWQVGAGTGLGEFNVLRVLALCQDRTSHEVCNFGLMGFADNSSVITVNREKFGRPLKYALPSLNTNKDTLVGSLEYSDLAVCTATMAYKQRALQPAAVAHMMRAIPEYNVKLMPSCDGGRPAIAELVRHHYAEFGVSEAWTGSANVSVSAHCNAPISDFRPERMLASYHIVGSSSVHAGEIVEDYLRK